MEFVNVGSVKKHCDTLKPLCEAPVSLVSLMVSFCTDSTSEVFSNAQTSVFGFGSADALTGFEGAGCPATDAGGEELAACCPSVDPPLRDGVCGASLLQPQKRNTTRKATNSSFSVIFMRSP